MKVYDFRNTKEFSVFKERFLQCKPTISIEERLNNCSLNKEDAAEIMRACITVLSDLSVLSNCLIETLKGNGHNLDTELVIDISKDNIKMLIENVVPVLDVLEKALQNKVFSKGHQHIEITTLNLIIDLKYDTKSFIGTILDVMETGTPKPVKDILYYLNSFTAINSIFNLLLVDVFNLTEYEDNETVQKIVKLTELKGDVNEFVETAIESAFCELVASLQLVNDFDFLYVFLDNIPVSLLWDVLLYTAHLDRDIVNELRSQGSITPEGIVNLLNIDFALGNEAYTLINT